MISKLVNTVVWIIGYATCVYFFITFIAPYFGWWNENLEERRFGEIGWLATHFIFGFFALFIPPFQFIPKIRNNYPKIHHTMGKMYILGAIASSLVVFYLLTNYPLPGSVPSLAFLDVLWLFTTITAYLLARRKNFVLHRQFMIRSYVCALAFVYLRLFDKLDHMSGALSFIKDEETRATVIDWFWVFPFIITEFFLQWVPSLRRNVQEIN